MLQKIKVRLDYNLPAPTDLLLQIEAAALPDQTIRSAHIDLGTPDHFARIPAEAGVGERIWLKVARNFRATYEAEIEVIRTAADLASLPMTPPHLLGPEPTRYLLPSRYCRPDRFRPVVEETFGGSDGGTQVAQMRDWIEEHFEYVPGVSDAGTTATDTFLARQGVCRDYAHVLVAMCRAASIPARVASVFAPSVEPPDFHAVAEVFLDGAWHLVDATGMDRADRMAKIGVGLDAAEVSFLTSFAPIELVDQEILVTEINE